MTKLKKFVERLEDFELAGFYKYRFESFMKESKRTILEEFKKRNISVHQVDKYLPTEKDIDKQKLQLQEICPRCYSNEFYVALENESISFDFSTVDYHMDYKTCLICLYSQDKEKHRKLRRKTWNIFSYLKFVINRKR